MVPARVLRRWKPLGSSESDDCKIDSIAQSWSVISDASVIPRGAPLPCDLRTSIWCVKMHD